MILGLHFVVQVYWISGLSAMGHGEEWRCWNSYTRSKSGAEDRNSVIPSPLPESLLGRSGMWGIPTPLPLFAEPETDGASRSCRQADIHHTPTRLACLHGSYVGVMHVCFVNALIRLKRPLNGQESWFRRGIRFSQVLLLALVRNKLVTNTTHMFLYLLIEKRVSTARQSSLLACPGQRAWTGKQGTVNTCKDNTMRSG